VFYGGASVEFCALDNLLAGIGVGAGDGDEVDRFREVFRPDHPRRFLRELAFEPSADMPRKIKQAVSDRYLEYSPNKTMWEQLTRSQQLSLMTGPTRNTRRNRYRVHTIQDKRPKLSLLMFDVDLHRSSKEAKKNFRRAIKALKTLDVFWTASPGRWLETEPEPFPDEERDPAKWKSRWGSRESKTCFGEHKNTFEYKYLNVHGELIPYERIRKYQQGLHVFLACVQVYRHDAARLLDEWLSAHNLLIETNLTTRGILVPGQDEYCLPCKPGKPDKPVCRTFDETAKLFMEFYDRNRNVQLKDALKLECLNTTTVSTGQRFTKSSTTMEERTVRIIRNRPRASDHFDIPGVSGPITVSKDSSGHFNPKVYQSIEDCKYESDGFNISNAYISRVFREQHGDANATFEIVDKHRQTLRTTNSSKNNGGIRCSHLRSFIRYLTRTYDPSQTKGNSKTATLDRAVMARQKSIERAYIIRALRSYISGYVGIDDETRRDLFSFLLDHDKWQRRYNGRIAARCTKGYKANPKNKTMQDFRACRGSRRRCTRLKNLAIKLGLLWISDPHNWFEAKCSAYGLGEKVLSMAEKMQTDDLEARARVQLKLKSHTSHGKHGINGGVYVFKQQEGRVSSTNIRAHPSVGNLAVAETTPLSYAMDEMDLDSCSDWSRESWSWQN